MIRPPGKSRSVLMTYACDVARCAGGGAGLAADTCLVPPAPFGTDRTRVWAISTESGPIGAASQTWGRAQPSVARCPIRPSFDKGWSAVERNRPRCSPKLARDRIAGGRAPDFGLSLKHVRGSGWPSQGWVNLRLGGPPDHRLPLLACMSVIRIVLLNSAGRWPKKPRSSKPCALSLLPRSRHRTACAARCTGTGCRATTHSAPVISIRSQGGGRRWSPTWLENSHDIVR